MTTSKKFIFTALILFFLDPVFSQDQDKQLGTVYQINRSNQEIVVASPRAGLLFKMGDLIYIHTDDKNVILTVTFPMQTVARCKIAKSHQKYCDEIRKGMPVFRYVPGDTLNSLQKDFERIDEIRLYNGRIIRGAIISRDEEYLILTPTGKIKIKENQIKNVRIIR